jgi:hypothetical protein
MLIQVLCVSLFFFSYFFKGVYVGQKSTGDHVSGFNYNFGDVTDDRAVSFWAFSGFAAHRLQFHE